MNKRLLIIVGIFGFLLILGVVAFLEFRRASLLVKPVVSPIEKEGEGVKLATWEDAAGFSFTYSEEVEIDPHEEDEENYAHLELTSFGRSGGMLVWVKGTNYTEIEDWVEQEGSGGQILDSELGGEPAKKIAYSQPAKLVTAAIDVDALVLVEMTPDKEGYWQEIYGQVIDSFAFVPLEGEEEVVAPGPWEGDGGASGIIEEAEEVIE